MAERVGYAQCDGLNIAYRTLGDGPRDIVCLNGFVSNLDACFDFPPVRRFYDRLASFARLIAFDRRGAGLSDAVASPPTLEERMRDVLAVMDAVGSERATLIGMSEGSPTAIVTAATHPERVDALVMIGGMARGSESAGYPYAAAAADQMDAAAELIAPHWGEGATVEIYAPSRADDATWVDFYARLERQGASLAMAWSMFESFMQIDVRDILSTIHVPTLVLHRRHDRVVNVRAGRYLAEAIPGAQYVELPGTDHTAFAESAPILDEIEEFVTGARSRAGDSYALRTLLFTDIVGSTDRAATLGDARWTELLAGHEALVRGELARFGGVEVKTLGDGFLAMFDAPGQAIRAALAISTASAAAGVTIRAGVHAGECDLRDGDPSGIVVHTTARVAALGGPDDVLVSRTVKDLVAGAGFTFTERGRHVLKGVPDEWELYAVTGSPTGR